ncbi:MAG TPA: hypothetical protein VGO40_23340 [Longimicrobium sp.]|jgi:hypothetical protein|nr:hypothetical protein [Longimicrobium sp.]
MIRRPIVALALAALAAGCRGRGEGEAQAAVRVDSARPVPQALAGFRAGLPRVSELGGAYAGDRDALVRRFVAALEASDSAAFMPMTLSRAEFAWLYYETDPQAKPPYELPPELMWSQGMQQGERGISRALERFGGRPLAFRGYACAREDDRRALRVWTGCRLLLGSAEVRLFGGIVEIGGRYKILSYANDL